MTVIALSSPAFCTTCPKTDCGPSAAGPPRDVRAPASGTPQAAPCRDLRVQATWTPPHHPLDPYPRGIFPGQTQDEAAPRTSIMETGSRLWISSGSPSSPTRFPRSRFCGTPHRFTTTPARACGWSVGTTMCDGCFWTRSPACRTALRRRSHVYRCPPCALSPRPGSHCRRPSPTMAAPVTRGYDGW